LDPFLTHADRAEALAALLHQDASVAEAVTRQLIASLPPSVWASDLCVFAADRGWRSCAGSFVLRAYDRQEVLALALEAEALTSLESLRRVLGAAEVAAALWQVASDEEEDPAPRAKAWELHVAVVGVDAARNQLLAAPAEPAGLLADLHLCARELHLIPRTVEEIITVRTLLAERASRGDSGTWDRWSVLAEALEPSQRRELALRHFPAIEAATDCRPDLLLRSRAELLDGLGRFVRMASRVPPHPNGQVVTDVPDALSHWADQLAWGDLLGLTLLAEAVEGDPTFRAALREQVELDLADDTHELGGLIRQTPPRGARRGCLPLEPYASGSASLGDVAFHPPAEMRARSPVAVAQYHFHAQERNSSVNAGPGRGDLRFAARTGSLCVLVTPCGRQGLNLDCFARLDSGRVFVVDLGTIAADEP
jgi:hypothetical protein